MDYPHCSYLFGNACIMTSNLENMIMKMKDYTNEGFNIKYKGEVDDNMDIWIKLLIPPEFIEELPKELLIHILGYYGVGKYRIGKFSY